MQKVLLWNTIRTKQQIDQNFNNSDLNVARFDLLN